MELDGDEAAAHEALALLALGPAPDPPVVHTPRRARALAVQALASKGTISKGSQSPRTHGPSRKPKKTRALQEPETPKRDTRCQNCGTRVTPQWRMGPDGPRSLCNACGVRYKKGVPLTGPAGQGQEPVAPPPFPGPAANGFRLGSHPLPFEPEDFPELHQGTERPDQPSSLAAQRGHHPLYAPSQLEPLAWHKPGSGKTNNTSGSSGSSSPELPTLSRPLGWGDPPILSYMITADSTVRQVHADSYRIGVMLDSPPHDADREAAPGPTPFPTPAPPPSSAPPSTAGQAQPLLPTPTPRLCEPAPPHWQALPPALALPPGPPGPSQTRMALGTPNLALGVPVAPILTRPRALRPSASPDVTPRHPLARGSLPAPPGALSSQAPSSPTASFAHHPLSRRQSSITSHQRVLEDYHME